MSARASRSALRALGFVVAAALAAAGVAGCSVSALEGVGYVGPTNSCSDTCSQGATCVDGACVAAKTSYPFFLEITTPTTAHFAPGTTFAHCIGEQSGGERNLDLPAPATVYARIEAPAVTCTNGKPLGASLRLVRVGAIPGAATGTFEARGAASDANPDGISLTVPPGTYDVYVAPTDDCAIERIPPYPLGTRTFGSGAQKLVVSYQASLPQFAVNLVDESSAPLTANGASDPAEARDLALIAKSTGQIVSTVAHTCGHESTATLTLAPVVARDPNDPLTHDYTLRITPAKEACGAVTPARVQPSYDVEFAGLSVDGGSSGTVAVLRASSVAPVAAFGDVRAIVSSAAVGAAIVLRSTALVVPTNSKLGTPFFVVNAEADAGSGKYYVEAPAGTYHAVAVPDVKSPYAVWAADVKLERNKSIATIGVPPKAPVDGLVVGLDGGSFNIGSVDALAVADTSAGALPNRSQSAPFALGKDAGASDYTRNFSLALDRGVYDFVARIPDASGYPWLLLPRIDVPQPTTSNPRLVLGTLTVAPPVRLSGIVRDPNGDPVSHASVRARAVLLGTGAKSDPSTCSFTSARAVSIAETQTDENGAYSLVVPADFATAKRATTP
jgi:hypothetical protein